MSHRASRNQAALFTINMNNQIRCSSSYINTVESMKIATPSDVDGSKQIANVDYVNTKIASIGVGPVDYTAKVDVVHAYSDLYLSEPAEGEAYTKMILNDSIELVETYRNNIYSISAPLNSTFGSNNNKFIVGEYNQTIGYTTNGNPGLGSINLNNNPGTYGNTQVILENPFDNNYVFIGTDISACVYQLNLSTYELTELVGTNGSGLNGTVRAMAWDYDTGSLICGGDFTQTNSGLVVKKIAKYNFNDNDWSSFDGQELSGFVGQDDVVNTICTVNNYGSTKYFFGGSFVGHHNGTGVINSPNLTCYDSEIGWVPFNNGAGIDNGEVLALTNDSYNNVLLIGGTFATISINGLDVSSNCFARWSYSDNQFYTDAGYFTGTSVNCIYYDNEYTENFFIGGCFTHAGVGNTNDNTVVQSNCIVQYDRYDNYFKTDDMKICVKASNNNNSNQVVRAISTCYYSDYNQYYLIFGGYFTGYARLDNLSLPSYSANNFIIIQLNNLTYQLSVYDNNTEEELFNTTKHYDQCLVTWDTTNLTWKLLETDRLQNSLSYPENDDYQKIVTVGYLNSKVSDSFGTLENTVNNLDYSVNTTLTNKVTDLSNNISGKTTQISDLSSNLHNLQVQVNNLPAGINIDDTVNNAVNMGYSIYPNFGKEWRELTNYSAANCLGISCSGDGRVVFIQGWSAQSKLTTDYGASWKSTFIYNEVTPITFNNAWSSAISLDGKYIALTDNNNFWLSTDYGKTFDVPSTRPNWANVVAVSATGKYMICGSINFASGIYVSSNYSQSEWTVSNTGVNWNAVAISPDGSIMLAGNASGVVKKSTNYGQTWSTIYTDSTPNGIKHIKCSEDGQIILICIDASSKLKLSIDGGSTFSDVANTQSYYNISMSVNGIYMTASYSGVLDYSVDRGTSWTTITDSKFWMNCMNYSGDIMYNANDSNKPLISKASTASVMATSAPTIATAGSTYFDTDTDKLYVYNGSSWKNVGLAT